MMYRQIYAAYRNDENVADGTVEELAKCLGVKAIRKWATPSYQKRNRGKRLLRNQQFKMAFEQLKQQGMSGRMIMLELCPKYGISERHGWDIIQHFALSDVSQAQLF